MRVFVRPTLLLAVAALLAACAKDGSSGGDPVPPPADPGTLVLRIQTAGGLLPPGERFRAYPELSLYADGRLIVVGPQIEIYPPPALPSLVVSQITRDGIRAILAAARDAGLLAPDRHLRNPTVADAGTTTFILVADGRRHVTSVEGLGIDAPADGDLRRRIQAFRERLGDLRSWLPKGSVGQEAQLAPSAMRIYVLKQPVATDQGLKQNPVNWPLSVPLSKFGAPGADPTTRCGVVEGGDLGRVLAVATQSNTLTPWKSGGRSYGMIFRPLLPDESGCVRA